MPMDHGAFVPRVLPVDVPPGTRPEYQLLPMGSTEGIPADRISRATLLSHEKGYPQVPGSTAQQLGLDLAQLNSIIQSTSEHKAEMDRLNAQVQSLAPVINQNMNSDAGRIMNNRLIEWTGDYNTLANDLQALNERVTGVRNALVAANAGAASTVGGR
jgi:hypothetical protein